MMNDSLIKMPKETLVEFGAPPGILWKGATQLLPMMRFLMTIKLNIEL